MKIAAVILLVVAVAIAVCAAEPPRRLQRTRSTVRKFQQLRQQQRRPALRPRFAFARQELADAPAPTPYPSADELKPEVPFVEEASAAQPDATYGPPDQTYGPPEIEPSIEQLPSDETPQQFAPNPEAEEFETEDDEPAIAEEEPLPSSRFTQRRQKPVPAKLKTKKSKASKAALRQRVTVKSDRLVAAVAPQSALPLAQEALVQTPLTFGVPLQQQRYVVVNHPFAYTAQAYQAW